MDRRTLCGILIAAVLGVIPAAAIFFSDTLQPAAEPSQGYRITFTAMGTVASFTFYTADKTHFMQAVHAGRSEFRKIVETANLYDKKSELSRLNRSAYLKPFQCSPVMWTLLMRAEQAYRQSGGRFDITVKPLMELWGFYRRRNSVPSDAEIKNALTRCGFDKLKFDREKHTVSFTVAGMALDLGGIAKGYAVDAAAAAVTAYGINSGVIDLGGNLKLLPEVPPGKSCYTVAVRNPAKRSEMLDKKLQLPGGCAVATSGDYERFVVLNGKRYGHIIDPLTGIPAANPAVTVVAPAALDADIFSTSAYLGGKKFSDPVENRNSDVKFYFFPAADN